MEDKSARTLIIIMVLSIFAGLVRITMDSTYRPSAIAESNSEYYANVVVQSNTDGKPVYAEEGY